MDKKLKRILIAALLICVVAIGLITILITINARNQNAKLNDLQNQIIQKDSVIKELNVRVIQRTKQHNKKQNDYQIKIDSMLNELNIKLK